MKWIEALIYWNRNVNPGKWEIPMSGTAEYNEIKALMVGEKKAPAKKAPAKKAKSTARGISNLDINRMYVESE